MNTRLWLAAFAVTLAAAPAAMAQNTYSSTYSGSTGSDSSMSTGKGSSGGASSRSATRRGSGQPSIAVRQTMLLNELSAAGFVTVRDFHKVGNDYVANVQDRQGQWMTVVLDPGASTIRPASQGTGAPAR
ncbi:hypothetical protein [Azospirillum ramasamyi]|uniref:PepSY domain-containing protein n=1 Tax=Azospirillum ramasamyi TaxID=682998 RepID=A0A2U9S4C7_9PROT|nr:hypothetical protein [Azospirillum ramasamyi]AWU93907.1 hypothetical protein DM194_06310 [Azospirillum ramasamyi]